MAVSTLRQAVQQAPGAYEDGAAAGCRGQLRTGGQLAGGALRPGFQQPLQQGMHGCFQGLTHRALEPACNKFQIVPSLPGFSGRCNGTGCNISV